jgi:hypothetical protein
MSVHEIDRKLSGLRFGEPQRCHGLTVFPLLEADPPDEDCLTLDEALARGDAIVTEISEGGSVPELRFRNQGDRPVLLLDGEELVGSKQNRILNLSILVPAHSEVVIPVSCVEAGRWAWRARSSGSSNRAIYSKLRSRKIVQVSEGLADSGMRHADQAEIWNDISAKAARMQAFSDTSASGAIYERYREDLDEFIGHLKPAASQVGAIFVVAGRPAGVEIFRSPKLFALLLPKLLRSYGLDALEERGMAEPATEPAVDVAGLLSSLRTTQAGRYKALGLGEDIRFDSDSMIGAALAENGTLIHLAAFPRAWAA